MMKKVLMLAVTMTTLSACEFEESGEPVSAVISIVDQNGDALTPDEAYWYLPPETDDTHAEFALECFDDACTQFIVPIDVVGDFYVAASYSRDVENAVDCWYQGYDASPVQVELPDDLSDWKPIEITLEVETDQMACQ